MLLNLKKNICSIILNTDYTKYHLNTYSEYIWKVFLTRLDLGILNIEKDIVVDVENILNSFNKPERRIKLL